jgi:pimeloyl-ACP methyl ester carboxylesterase
LSESRKLWIAGPAGRLEAALRAADRSRGLVTIGLPVASYDFRVLEQFRPPIAAVHGTEDELAAADEVRELMARLDPAGAYHPIDGASHLFPGRAPDAAAAVVRAVESILSAFG